MRKHKWANPFGRRCKFRITKYDSQDYWGRCELKPHPVTVPHALERSMVNLRWVNKNWLEGG